MTEPDIAEQLKTLRESRGLGVRELARIAHVPASAVSRMEHGHGIMLSTALKIASALRVSLPIDWTQFAPPCSHFWKRICAHCGRVTTL